MDATVRIKPVALRATLVILARDIGLIRGIGNPDLNCRINHASLVCGVRQGRAKRVLPVRDVELPAMPWAGDNASLNLARANRPARVRADSIHGVNRAVDVENRDNQPGRNHFLSRSRRKFCQLSNSGPVSH